ncbi:MAG: zinc-binding dehydrogenase, partial [Nocardioidaceae bacterium]
KRLGTVADTTTVVFGAGPIGLSAVMFAKSMGADVIAVDIDANRLEQAKRFGADVVVNSREESLVDIVKDHTNGRLAEVAMETSGHASKDAFSILAPFGRMVITGLPGRTEFVTQEVYKNQWTIMTSWTMSFTEQARCADYVVKHDLPVDDLFSHTWTLDQAQEAYEWFSKQDAGKGVFEFSG